MMTTATKAPTLSAAQIQEELHKLRGWKHEDGALVRDYTLPDFVAAFAFVARLALMAEKEGHHPDIDIRYNKVRVALVSHDAGGITAKDAAMAAAIQKLEI